MPETETVEAITSAAGGEVLSAEERARIPGLIAFVTERGSNKDVWLARPDGRQWALTRGEEDEFPAAPAPGGAGMLVIAAREIDGLHRELVRLVRLDGKSVDIGAPRARARNPSWGPDGSWFVVESDQRGFSDLVRVPVDGGGPVPIATAPEGNFEPSVSPDGSQVAFVSSRDGDPEIYVMNADGSDVRRLSAFHREDWGPRWSPDGRWIAFLSNREGRARVFVVRPDGTGVRAVSGDAPTGDEREPAWSPDGRELAFVGRQADGTTQIWKAPVAGGPARPLSDGSSRDDQPSWSPDGRYLAFVSERDGQPELYLMRADGSGQTRLTESPGADWLPRWFGRPDESGAAEPAPVSGPASTPTP